MTVDFQFFKWQETCRDRCDGTDVELDVGQNEVFFVERLVTRGRAELRRDRISAACRAGAVVVIRPR